MGAEARTTTVRILGQEYRIRTEESPEFVETVALHVDETLRAIAARMSTGTAAQIAVLGALNIAEELFRERRDGSNGTPTKEIESRVKAMLGRLEEVVGDAVPRARRTGARAGSRG
jgi:cell division protein ZapA